MLNANLQPLLRLRGLREEVRAGFGNAAIAVRTLDDVSLEIHANELILIHGLVASGAASLVAAALAKRPPLGVRSGTREVGEHVQIRRGQITAAAWFDLERAWVRCPIDRPIPAENSQRATTNSARVLYVLRVAEREPDSHRIATWGRRNPRVDWTSWVLAIRQRGGSVLAHATTALTTAVEPNAPRSMVREQSRAQVTSSAAANDPRNPSSVRILHCDSGRLFSAADRTSAPASPSACDPCPTV